MKEYQLTIFDLISDDESTLDTIKTFIKDAGYGHLLKGDTKVCLSHVDVGRTFCQFEVMLLNEDVMTSVTIRKDGSSFSRWELSPISDKYYYEHKKYYFTESDKGLYFFKYKLLEKTVEEFNRFFKGE